MKGQIAFEAQPFELDLESQGIGRSGRWFRRGSSIVVLPEIGPLSGGEMVYELSSGNVPSAAAMQAGARTAGGFDIHAAKRFAKLALACIRKEYPNKISHAPDATGEILFYNGDHAFGEVILSRTPFDLGPRRACETR